jgi:hypothetical protein
MRNAPALTPFFSLVRIFQKNLACKPQYTVKHMKRYDKSHFDQFHSRLPCAADEPQPFCLASSRYLLKNMPDFKGLKEIAQLEVILNGEPVTDSMDLVSFYKAMSNLLCPSTISCRCQCGDTS